MVLFLEDKVSSYTLHYSRTPHEAQIALKLPETHSLKLLHSKISNAGHHTSLTGFLKSILLIVNLFFTLLGLYKSKYCSPIVPPKEGNLKVTIRCCHVKTAKLETNQRLFLICLKTLCQNLNNP